MILITINVNVANNPNNNTKNRIERYNHRKYFILRVNTAKYHVLIDGRDFMINQLIIKSKNRIKSEKLQQDREMIIQQDVC